MPANSQIFRDEFIKIIEFELLQPEPFIQIFYPEFNMMNWVNGMKVMVTDRDQEQSVANDMKLYMFLAAIGTIIVLILSVV